MGPMLSGGVQIPLKKSKRHILGAAMRAARQITLETCLFVFRIPWEQLHGDWRGVPSAQRDGLIRLWFDTQSIVVYCKPVVARTMRFLD